MSKKAKKKAPARTAITILGMHRSGTSALAGLISLFGCDLPATPMPANRYNERGYYESAPIRNLNDKCLASAGSVWNDWLGINPGWYDSPYFDGFRDQVEETLASEYGQSPFFILKDPRICRLLPLWKPAMRNGGITPVFVHTHRNPLDVAASLKSRDGLPEDLGLLIWLRHVLDAEAGSRGDKRVFVNYDQVLENWAAVMRKLETGLALQFPRNLLTAAGAVEEFLSRDMEHHHAPRSNVLDNPLIPEWVATVYRIVQDWSETQENKADHAELDRVRAELGQSGFAFVRLVEAEEAARKDLAVARSEAGEAQARIVELSGERDRSADAAAAAEAAGTEQKERAAQAEVRNRQLIDEKDRLAQDLAEQGKQAVALRDELAEQTARADDAAARLAKQEAMTEEARAALDARTAQAQEARDAVSGLEDRLSQLQSELRQRQHEAEQVGRENDELKRQLETAGGDLEAARAEQEALRKSASEQEAALAEAASREAELSAELELGKLELIRAREQVADLERRTETQSKELVILTREQVKADDRIERLKTEHKAQVEELDTRFRHAHEQHLDAQTAKSKELAESESRVQSQIREIAELSRLLAETETRQVAEANERARLREEALLAEVEAERQRADFAEVRFGRVVSSTSWRALAPMRAFVNLFRRG